ncbi:MAG TPA: hypothetical protein PKE27_08290 [Povalibacter sp.]|uniref:hypothetical protein n=1 Tax=Povalibacter sp. TaxID=1962978 RepID=UPI002CB1B28B|nr:hypothetical protein [Povalibacter sp.]HMN44556.1 hypothetical protein [Povalibacter sp.]
MQGLDYSDGVALMGTTGADGGFRYAQGNTVTFKLGGLTLGSYPGQPFMSPMHLIGTPTNVAQQIENRARLLQMLDIDGNPDNGILISEAVRAVAVDWTTPDFGASYTDFATAVQPLVAAASAADGTAHVLPSEVTARDHFVRTAWCTYNGIYRGTYTGSGDNGVWTMVTYGTGARMFGAGYSTVDRAGFELEKQSGTGLSIFPTFSAGTATNGATFSGSFRTPDTITGTWTNGPDSGTFSGARSGGSSTAVYRISGYVFPLGTALLINLEIDAADRITGSIIDRDYQGRAEPVAVTGTLSGTTFAAAAAGNQYVFTSTFNKNASSGAYQLTGSLRDNVKGRDIGLNSNPLQGCRLN